MNQKISEYKLPNEYPKESSNLINNNIVEQKIENNINSELSILKSKKLQAKTKKVTWTVQVTKELDKRISLFMLDNGLTRTEAIEFLLNNSIKLLNK